MRTSDSDYSRCTLVDRVKSCISFACALKGLPSGPQALIWLDLYIILEWPVSCHSTGDLFVQQPKGEGQARPPRQWRRRFTAHAPKKNVHNCYFLWPCGWDLHVESSRAEPSRVESSRACTPKKWRAPLGTGVNKKWHVNKLEKIDTKV